MHYYQHHIGDYLASTTHLTLLEHGIYFRLMMLYYQNECALDANALRMICARSADEVQAAEIVLNEFFTKTDLGWVHTRCDAEIAKFHNKSDKAKASAKARWGGDNADVMRTHSECNANHKPITNNQEPLTTIKDSSSKDDVSECEQSDQKIACPHKEILALYHQKLTECPRVVEYTSTRQGLMRSRWNEQLKKKKYSDRESGLASWGRFFDYVADSDFLTGRAEPQQGKPPFVADFEWLMRPTNFAKVVEGKYHR